VKLRMVFPRLHRYAAHYILFGDIHRLPGGDNEACIVRSTVVTVFFHYPCCGDEHLTAVVFLLYWWMWWYRSTIPTMATADDLVLGRDKRVLEGPPYLQVTVKQPVTVMTTRRRLKAA